MSHPATPTDPAEADAVSPGLTVDGPAPVLSGRRGVLRSAGAGLGLVVGAGVVAACSSPPVKPEAAPSEPSSPSAPPASDPSAAEGTPEASPSKGAAAGGTATSKVPVGGGTIFADTKTVVTQPKAGTFKAFDTTCPHAGCAVAKVADGKIDCPCHGSQFDITTGDRVAGPAPKGLSTKKITVDGDRFTVA